MHTKCVAHQRVCLISYVDQPSTNRHVREGRAHLAHACPHAAGRHRAAHELSPPIAKTACKTQTAPGHEDYLPALRVKEWMQLCNRSLRRHLQWHGATMNVKAQTAMCQAGVTCASSIAFHPRQLEAVLFGVAVSSTLRVVRVGDSAARCH